MVIYANAQNGVNEQYYDATGAVDDGQCSLPLIDSLFAGLF